MTNTKRKNSFVSKGNPNLSYNAMLLTDVPLIDVRYGATNGKARIVGTKGNNDSKVITFPKLEGFAGAVEESKVIINIMNIIGPDKSVKVRGCKNIQSLCHAALASSRNEDLNSVLRNNNIIFQDK